MASYEKRKEELTKALALIKPTIPEEESKKLEEAIKQYCEARDEVLNRMFLISADTGYNKRESDWKDLMGKARDAVKSKLEDSLSSFREPSPSGWVFANGTAVIEHKFWSSLEKLSMGTRRDDMMLLVWNLEQKTKELEKKWETIEVENKPLLEQEKRASEIVKVTLDKVIEGSKLATVKLRKGVTVVTVNLTNFVGELADIAAETVKYLGMGRDKDVTKDGLKALLTPIMFLIDITQIPSPPDLNVIAPILEQTDILLVGVGDYKKPMEEYRDKSRRQIDSIITAFQQTRRETDEFIKKSGYDVAKKQYEEAVNALKSWSNELLTDKLKDDGKQFAESLTGGLGSHLLNMDAIFNNFVKYNEGRFFGSVKPDIAEALIQTRMWDDELKMLVSRGRDLDETLRQWRSDVHQLEIDLNEAFAEVEAEISRQVEEVQQELRPLIEKFKDEMISHLRTALERLDHATDDMQQQASMDKLRQDFDRSTLLDAMRR